MKTNDGNLHEGHRARLLDLALNAGVDNMSDIQVVEFFLTYIFPRGDVNPLAHRLLKEYETFAQIVDADVNDLMRIDGINERAAKKIALFGELFYYYTSAKMGRKYIVKNIGDIIDVIEDHLRFRTTENMLILAISAGNIITHKRRINMHNSSTVGIPVLELTKFMATSKPVSLVVAHCHPYGKAVPSEEDKEGFDMINNLCMTCGVNLIDSYIVGEEGVYSMKDNQIVRHYYDIEQLKEAFSSVAK